ncbi:Uncharacterised protein [Fluoribacter dumoffii]|uniref:Uncharacterized protein n=1 Tax=Fluoribacter dumoffii TaxID=463 RepID=A0A377G7H0_9GAMM|nr:Uncharacterised protein [Fluoribacter dumoffii]
MLFGVSAKKANRQFWKLVYDFLNILIFGR